MAHKAACHTLSKGFEINEDMAQIRLMLEVLLTQDSKVEGLFCGASLGSEPSLFFSNYFLSLGFKPIQHEFQHDFARTTYEADSSVALAELHVALFRECNNRYKSKSVQMDVNCNMKLPKITIFFRQILIDTLFVDFKPNVCFTSEPGGGRVVRWCWVNFQCLGVLQFGLQ